MLTPDGVHVWTVPQISTLMTSKPRVRRGPSGLEYLEPVEVHGDPVCEDGAIVTFDWGQDLPARVEAASGMSTAVFRVESRQLGLLGEFRDVFVSHHGLGNPAEDLRRRSDVAAAELDGLRAAVSISEQERSRAPRLEVLARHRATSVSGSRDPAMSVAHPSLPSG